MTVNFRKLILSPICWFLTGRGQPNRGAVGVREASAVAGALGPWRWRLRALACSSRAQPGGLRRRFPWCSSWNGVTETPLFRHLFPSRAPRPAGRGLARSGQAARLCSQTGPCGGGARMGEKSGNENRGARLLRRARPGRGHGGCFLDHSGLRNPRRHTDLDVSSNGRKTHATSRDSPSEPLSSAHLGGVGHILAVATVTAVCPQDVFAVPD